MKIKIVIFFLSSLFVCSCTTQEERTLKSFRKFTISLQNHSSMYSEEDWSKSIQEYELLTSSLENGRFTELERREIGKLKGQCVAIYSQYAIQIYESEIKNAAIELEGALEGFFETFKMP